MLKIIKKALMLSFFAFSLCTFPSAFAMRRVAQAAVARTLNQSAPFRYSLGTRCPFSFAAVMALVAVEPAAEVEMQTQVLIATESVDISAVKNYEAEQNVITDNQVFVVVDADNTIHCYEPLYPESAALPGQYHSEINNQKFSNFNKNHAKDTVQGYVSSHGGSTAHNQQLQSHNDSINGRIANQDKQSAQHMSQIYSRIQEEHKQAMAVANVKAQLSFDIENHSTNVRNQVSKIIASFSSLSDRELQNKLGEFNQLLPQLKTKLQSLCPENSQIDLIVNPEKHDEIREFMPSDASFQDICKVSEALDLKFEIKVREAVIQSIHHTLQQEVQVFKNQLEFTTLDDLKQTTMPGFVAEKETNVVSIAHKEDRVKDLNKEIKTLEIKLESCNKSWFGAKSWRWISGDEIQKILNDNLKTVKAKKEQIVQDLAMLNHKQQELETKIAQIQNVIAEKQRTQEVELAQQNHEQETLIRSEKYVQSQHDACSFDLENCLNPGLKQKWSDRQNALFNTMEEGYKQFDQKFDLNPQVLGFLAAQGIDPKEFQNCFGTILQQQLHQEMCDILSQTALLQANYSYHSELVQSIVDFADAAHDANKNGQVLLAAELVDVDCSLLEIVEAIQPYGQALASGVVHSAVDLVHAASHPVETIQGLGKAICYVLKTVAINCQENGLGDVYMPLDEQSYLKTKEMLENFDHFRDQRNAEIVQALNNLGDQITNASGPEKFEALVRFGADFVVPGKIIHAVGGVCGAIKAETNIARAAELVAEAQEQTGSTKFINAVAENVSKVEQAVQEKIVQNIAENLLDAEKQFDKAVKLPIAQKIKRASDAPPAIDMRSLLNKNLEIAENAVKDASCIKKLSDGRIRYYEAETLSSRPGPTRGSAYVIEYDPNKGIVRSWYESYDHFGNVNRVHPKMINGKNIDSLHYPHTGKELEQIFLKMKDKK